MFLFQLIIHGVCNTVDITEVECLVACTDSKVVYDVSNPAVFKVLGVVLK